MILMLIEHQRWFAAAQYYPHIHNLAIPGS